LYTLSAPVEIRKNQDFSPAFSFYYSGQFDAAMVLAGMDEKIAVAKQNASKRKDILDKVEKWALACEEETWLEDYNRVGRL
jgi:protein regulator of cytokinesis 1